MFFIFDQAYVGQCLFVLCLLLFNVEGVILPSRRAFLPLKGMLSLQPNSLTLRIQQFNLLADGLSGARDDLGRFSRATQDMLDWENRREALLHEIVQYDADIVTLQECDHFQDFLHQECENLVTLGTSWLNRPVAV